MAAINPASTFLCCSSSSSCQGRNTRATINIPKKLQKNTLSLIPKIPSNKDFTEEMGFTNAIPSLLPKKIPTTVTEEVDHTKVSDPTVIAKLYAIMEAVADRVEMHKNIGDQRNNWNSLLLTSINTITLSAATMAAIAASSGVPSAALVALKLSSTFMYLAATGMLIVMNKIQPSQLAEEQRNAARLFKQLHGQIQTKIAIGTPTLGDVSEAMEEVLSIDRAYPLPLLGTMLDRFPSKVQPAVWWPKERRSSAAEGQNGKTDGNGWDGELEEEMREIIRVFEVKDKADYLRLDAKALKLNKVLAIAGPVLTGLGALGSAFLGSSSNGSWAVVFGVLAGAMASVVNSLEHGGQVGMVVEMYRSNAGFFRLIEESIESNLEERDCERREDGELFEMKLALQLGRSLPELRDLVASYERKGDDIEEFGSKLF